MGRLLSPASGLPDTTEPFRSLFHLQSFPKARMHQDKGAGGGGGGGTMVETIPRVQADWPVRTLTGVRENQHLAFHRLDAGFFTALAC